MIAQTNQCNSCIFALADTNKWLCLVLEQPGRLAGQVGNGKDACPRPEEDGGDDEGSPDIDVKFAVCFVQIGIEIATGLCRVEVDVAGDEEGAGSDGLEFSVGERSGRVYPSLFMRNNVS